MRQNHNFHGDREHSQSRRDGFAGNFSRFPRRHKHARINILLRSAHKTYRTFNRLRKTAEYCLAHGVDDVNVLEFPSIIIFLSSDNSVRFFSSPFRSSRTRPKTKFAVFLLRVVAYSRCVSFFIILSDFFPWKYSIWLAVYGRLSSSSSVFILFSCSVKGKVE